MAATVAELGARVLRRLGVTAVAASERNPNPDALVDYADIGRLALQWIGVVAANEAPEPADQAIATFKAQAVHHSLVAQGFTAWGNGNAVPSSLVEDFVILTAMHLAPSFGREVDIKGMQTVEARVRRVSIVARATEIAEQAVQDVHSKLDARGKARWSVFDIPDYAEEPYVALAANLVAPHFEAKPDPLAEQRAMIELAQVVALPSSGEQMRQDYF